MSQVQTPSVLTPTSPRRLSDRIAAFVAAALTYEGTPFHHQGRVPGVGLDCAGVLVCALRAAGETVVDRVGYTRFPLRSQLSDTLRANFGSPLPKPTAGTKWALREGDVVALRQANRVCHVALALSPTRLLHAYSPAKKVVKTDLAAWYDDIADVYRMRE